jgi:antitoxin HicB
MMSQPLEYYLALPYTIEITPDDGAWFVQVKELPGCMTEVDEWDEIRPMIDDIKRLWIESALAHNQPIPQPLGVLAR